MIVSGIGGLAVFAAANPAYCAWCPNYTCYSRCSPQCACMSSGTRGGTCVSIQAIPEGAILLGPE